MVAAALDGWQLAGTIIAAIFVFGLIIVLMLMREGKSKKLRVGMFVEREYDPDYAPYDREEDHPSEWPTQH